jgi:hypothetical protein
MKRNFYGLLCGLGLVLISSTGALFFGFSFKVYFVVLVLCVWGTVALILRHREKVLLAGLRDLTPEEQDLVLAPLDDDHRKKMLKQLGRL